MADNTHGNSPSQRDKEKRSRSARIAKGVGKGLIATSIGGAAIGGAKLVRGNTSPASESSTINPQEAVSEAENIIQEAAQKSEDEKIQDIMMGRAPQPTSSREAPSTKKPSRVGQAAKTVGKGAGKFTMYTSPGAFVVGKFLGRKKERDEAKREIEQIRQNAQERPSKKPRKPNFFTKSSKRIGDIVAKTTGAYWINKYVLQRFRKQKEATEENQATGSGGQTNTQSHKSQKQYQNWWNKKILEKTASQRQFIKQQLNKFFKSRAWKYGKYALSPLGAAAYDIHKYRQTKLQPKKNEDWYMSHYNNPPKDRSESSGQHGSPKNPVSQRMKSFTKNSGRAIYKYTTPSGQMQAAWNRWGKSRMPSFNSRLGRRFGNVPSPRQVGRKAASNIGNQIGKKLAKQVVLTFLKTPPGWVTLGVIAAVFLFFGFMMVITSVLFGGGGGGGGTQVGGGTPGGSLPGAGTNPIPGFTLSKSVSEASIPEPAEITYTISFSHDGTIPLGQITIYDQLPQNTTLVTNKTTGDFQIEGPIISWNLSSPLNTSPLTLTILPITTDILISNQAYALASQTTSEGSGNLAAILPENHLSSAKSDAEQQKVVEMIRSNPSLVEAYRQAEAGSGVPWQILAGLHYREGSLNPNTSLVSGRPIGENEPDIVRGGGCSSTYTPGQPVALPDGGCGFRTFADSATYAANHFKNKNGGTSPGSFTELTKSLSYYNGGGNANCGKTPYQNCPAQFTGDDDTYVMNYFDAPHERMYIVYCADFTLCNPPVLDQRPGVASVIMGLNRFY